jgi:hypothetical protein
MVALRRADAASRVSTPAAGRRAGASASAARISGARQALGLKASSPIPTRRIRFDVLSS